ncbi:MAG: DUF1080 domain-containing protein [Thermoguttaceae bacterium]|nr:DUF1080 domain-containing protein [Thermoguttaceae bacterium]
MMKRIFCYVALVCASVASVALAADKKDDNYDAVAESQKDDAKYDWVELFDGERLDYWIDLEDPGAAKIEVKNGAIALGMGAASTSVKFNEEEFAAKNYDWKFPRENYELEFVARRTLGVDFFSAATVPVGENCITFVNGGWGGSVVGLSSIDDMDASENSASTFYAFADKRWYRFRIQATPRVVRVWINGEIEIDAVVGGHKVGTRYEVKRCEPLGFSSWVTSGEIKTIRVRDLTKEEIAEMDARADKEEEFFKL